MTVENQASGLERLLIVISRLADQMIEETNVKTTDEDLGIGRRQEGVDLRGSRPEGRDHVLLYLSSVLANTLLWTGLTLHLRRERDWFLPLNSNIKGMLQSQQPP
jgi:hypothetical protein